ncbi:uncharacterized protein LOC110035920 [Phalaenopsis equestris]|uniref:uncharacterized protein LOC110035920 n=1 Tax=Phalaenopsis equestris TaxID=78828 RepID=UPI0009E22900|nr:uncharacterized protein LOC110035920 [Phalaenopsis equestris]
MRSTAAASASSCFGKMLRLVHSFSEHMHKPPVKFPISPFHFSTLFRNTPFSKNSCAPLSVNWNFRPDLCPKPLFWNFYHDHHLDSLPDADAKAEDRSPCNVKLLCSFGGKLIPRGNDGNLHYVGGQKRIFSVHRDTAFQEFYFKMEKTYGGPVRICYQLPGQNLNILVSVGTAEDLEHMMDEFDSLSKDCNHKSAKLRIFLFPPFDPEHRSAGLEHKASNVSRPSYIDATNEALAFDANTLIRHSKANTKQATITRNSNARGEAFINDALESQNFRIRSNVVGTRNVATQTEEDIERPHLHQQQQGDSTSLFSDQDPWKIFGFQLSNL